MSDVIVEKIIIEKTYNKLVVGESYKVRYNFSYLECPFCRSFSIPLSKNDFMNKELIVDLECNICNRKFDMK